MRYVAGMRAALRPRTHLSTEEMNALAERAKGDVAEREQLVLACMGLIASTAKRCRNSLGEDAFSEASIALLEAVENFDIEMGDFRTWAVYCMRCHLSYKSRSEQRYRARILRGDEILSPADVSPLPELLTTAVNDGALTKRQAQIVQMKAAGLGRMEIADSLAISERTYRYEIERSVAALRSYL